jgi:hypothetical protein
MYDLMSIFRYMIQVIELWVLFIYAIHNVTKDVV